MRAQDEFNREMASEKAIAAVSALAVPTGVGIAKTVDNALKAHR